jgi:hypothetical protein
MDRKEERSLKSITKFTHFAVVLKVRCERLLCIALPIALLTAFGSPYHTDRMAAHRRPNQNRAYLCRDNGRTIWIADAHRGDGKRFVLRADEKLSAFL